MNKLATLIQGMKEEDLIKIQKDLVSGNLDRLITKKLSDSVAQSYNEKICPICGGHISDTAFKLEFGKSYLRRRAFFDGVDCLEYFIHSKLKDVPKKEITHN